MEQGTSPAICRHHGVIAPPLPGGGQVAPTGAAHVSSRIRCAGKRRSVAGLIHQPVVQPKGQGVAGGNDVGGTRLHVQERQVPYRIA